MWKLITMVAIGVILHFGLVREESHELAPEQQESLRRVNLEIVQALEELDVIQQRWPNNFRQVYELLEERGLVLTSIQLSEGEFTQVIMECAGGVKVVKRVSIEDDKRLVIRKVKEECDDE